MKRALIVTLIFVELGLLAIFATWGDMDGLELLLLSQLPVILAAYPLVKRSETVYTLPVRGRSAAVSAVAILILLGIWAHFSGTPRQMGAWAEAGSALFGSHSDLLLAVAAAVFALTLVGNSLFGRSQR